MIKEKFIGKIITFFSLLLLLYGCNAEDNEMTNIVNKGFDIGSTFVRLSDDSTQTAGYLDIVSNVPKLSLKWNALADFNIDTTSCTVEPSGGKYRLPIKWNKKLKDGNYGPSTKAFEGGVTISDGNDSKYVRLFWTDGLDSVQIAKESIMTRSGEERAPILLDLFPTEQVIMHQELGGAVFVQFSGIPVVSLNLTNLTSETNIDIQSLPMMMYQPGEVKFKWKNDLAPNINFAKAVRVTATSSVYKDIIVTYQIPDVNPAYYEFKSSLPENGGLLPAENANVSVTVNTNKTWSIESDLGTVPSMSDADVSALGNRNLILPIQTNTEAVQRVVTVIVKSQGVAKDTLTFTQLAAAVQETLVYKSSTLPVGNIPQEGGTYGFVFDGTYTGSVQVRAVIDGVAQTPGAAVTNKEPQCVVPENTLTNERNITFEYKQADGDWTTLPTSTNRIQDANNDSETLNYVSSNLPAGNIPATATVYTFNFEGGYAGRLRVRAVDATTGTVLFNGPIGTTHSPKVTVPANPDTTPRNIKFQYRLIDVENSPWEDLPASTNRIQDGKTVNPITPVHTGVFPSGEIPEKGGAYSCEFEGGPGSVILRAVRTRVNEATGVEVARSTETSVPGTETATVVVPELGGLNATVSFEYSVDGGENWISLNDSREQKNTWVFVASPDANTRIAAKGGSVTFSITGNADMQVTIYAKYNNVEIGKASGTPPTELTVPVEDNPDTSERRVAFMWSLDGEKWVTTYYTQLGK